MHEKSPVLKATPREKPGSRYAKRAREQGLLPAVIYGHKREPVSVNLTALDAIPHLEQGEKVFRVDIAGAQMDANEVMLLKELQFDYLGDTIVHADFARVSLDERVKAKVHVNLTGEAKGLKNAGAILIHPTSEIEIECRVRDLPEFITVNVADLELDQVITAAQVKLPGADMKLITDGHAIVAQIVEQKEEVVAEAAVVAAEGDAAPEVIGEKERLEKAAAAGAAGAKPGAAPAKGAAPAAGAKPAAGGAAKPAAGAKPAAPKK
ncbi:MAG: 50S ribosomal protein L25 [Phycisphaerales bacterium]